MTLQALSPAQTAFDRLGGDAGVARLVDVFYRNMGEFPAARGVRALHGESLANAAALLKLYLAEWLGGRNAYSAQRGHPRLRMRHLRFPIGPTERDAWMLCMGAALDETVADASLRERLKTDLAKLADWVRNDLDNAHDKHR